VDEPSALILAFVADLYFSSRIESAAAGLGLRYEAVETADQIGAGEISRDLTAAGALIDRISRRGPALIIFDLNNQAVPWRKWIPLLKSDPATRRIPQIAFGSHMDVESLGAAREAGAEAVLARSAFVADLPALILKYLHATDRDAVDSACMQPLSELALEGIRLFNAGEYFEAHEVLEHAWNADLGPGRDLYRAVLQVAVAYLQIERGNFRGAVKMFMRLRQWLEPLPPVCRKVDVERLRQDARRVEDALLVLGPEGVGGFDRGLFNPVRVVE